MQVFGDKHYALSACYSHLGRLCSQKNDFQGAIDYYQKTLEIYETTLPPAHNDIILMHANLASAAYKSKNYQLSEQEFNFALKLSEEKDSSASERTKVIIYNGLAAVYREQEKYEKAKATGEKALSICLCSSGSANQRFTLRQYRKITTSYHSSIGRRRFLRYFAMRKWFSSANFCSSSVSGALNRSRLIRASTSFLVR